MKRITLLLPFLALTAFAGYYRHWEVRHTAAMREGPTTPYDAYRYRDGHQEAVADLARGRLRVVGYGLPARWRPEYREVLLRDAGIEYRAIAGCVVTDGILKYAATYNEVMEPRIRALHGWSMDELGDQQLSKQPRPFRKIATRRYQVVHPPSERSACWRTGMV